MTRVYFNCHISIRVISTVWQCTRLLTFVLHWNATRILENYRMTTQKRFVWWGMTGNRIRILSNIWKLLLRSNAVHFFCSPTEESAWPLGCLTDGAFRAKSDQYVTWCSRGTVITISGPVFLWQCTALSDSIPPIDMHSLFISLWTSRKALHARLDFLLLKNKVTDRKLLSHNSKTIVNRLSTFR